MTAEQQQIAITELLGIKKSFNIQVNNHGHMETRWFDTWKQANEYPFRELGCAPVEEYRVSHLPDINDLNVIHEVEKRLPDRAEYALMLYRVCVNKTPDSYAHWSDIGDSTFDAGAEQRVEAILRTIGKWTD
jgi:hypothetical protein